MAHEVSESAGIAEVTRTWSANVHDFNGDGWDDVLVVRHNEAPARLYRNDGGAFTEVNSGLFHGLGIPVNPDEADRHDCAWGDVDGDGRPDVYCTLGAEKGHGTKANELWMQRADGTFVERAAEYGVTDPFGRGRHATFIDVNHDAYPDLYVGNGYPRRDSHVSRNRLFINRRGERFRSAPGYGLDRQVGGFAVQAVDFDRDGWSDLFVCGQEGLRLYRNVEGERFHNVARRRGVTGGCVSGLLTDLNGDRRVDLVRLRERSLSIQLQDDGAVFRRPVFRRALQNGRSVAAGDADGDLRPDLYVLQSSPEPGATERPDLMLVNGGSGHSFSRVEIPQTSAGRGDAVASIDYDRNGLNDFIVLNGRLDSFGPIRLIAFE